MKLRLDRTFVVLLILFSLLLLAAMRVKAQDEPNPQFAPAYLTLYLYYDSNGTGMVDVGDQAAHNVSTWLKVTRSDGSVEWLHANNGALDYVKFTLQDCLCAWEFYANGQLITSGSSIVGDNRIMLLIVEAYLFMPFILR